MIEPKNILIVRTDRIGDVVLTLPLAGIIKKHHPDCKVTFLVNDYTKEIAKSNKLIDEVITLKLTDDKIDFTSSLNEIKQRRFDLAIVVYPKFTVALLIFLSGIKKRIGSGYRWYSFLFNEKVFEHRKNAERHELEYNINLLRKIGINEDVNKSDVKFNLDVDKDSLNKVKSLLAESGIKNYEVLIIAHPGSGGSSVDLPLIKFKELIEKTSAINDIRILLTGSESERKICDEISSGEKTINLAGKLSISELTALISLSKIFISNSTGPLHIAGALNVFVIGFYPKIIACSAKRWGPYNKKNIIFEPIIDCNNCTVEQCEKLDCMNSIDVGRVFDKVKAQLKN
jgi:ADP-heptose:LPS heptosyltransferase